MYFSGVYAKVNYRKGEWLLYYLAKKNVCERSMYKFTVLKKLCEKSPDDGRPVRL